MENDRSPRRHVSPCRSVLPVHTARLAVWSNIDVGNDGPLAADQVPGRCCHFHGLERWSIPAKDSVGARPAALQRRDRLRLRGCRLPYIHGRPGRNPMTVFASGDQTETFFDEVVPRAEFPRLDRPVWAQRIVRPEITFA